MTTTKALLEALRRCATRDCFTECCYFDDKDCWPHILQDAAKHILLLTLENSNLREENQVLRETKETKPLRYWAEQIHANAVDHGWWDEDRSFGEIVALCHSELSEALEEYRAGRPMEWYACTESEGGHPCGPKDETECYYFGREETCKYHGEKPEGIAVEMIDCLIRILDWCGKEGVDVDEILARKHEYNKTRPYRHGGKKL